MFPERLLSLRKKMKLTQKELAVKLGIARTTYAGYESGAREPDHKTLQKMADFFEVSIDYLLGRTDDPSQVLPESARVFIDAIKLELTDKEIMEKIQLTVDGQELPEEIIKAIIALARASHKKDNPSNT